MIDPTPASVPPSCRGGAELYTFQACDTQSLGFVSLNRTTGQSGGRAQVTARFFSVTDPKSRQWIAEARIKVDQLGMLFAATTQMQAGFECDGGCKAAGLSAPLPIMMGENLVVRTPLDSPGVDRATHKLRLRVRLISEAMAGPWQGDEVTRPLRDIRCDSVRADYKGCVYPGTLPTIQFDAVDFPYIANNIVEGIAFHGSRLNRASDAKYRQTRASVCGRSFVRPPGGQCDEYPFATTTQGGPGARELAVPARENTCQGVNLKAFYGVAHVLKPVGNEVTAVGDEFAVEVLNPARRNTNPFTGTSPAGAAGDENSDGDAAATVVQNPPCPPMRMN